MSDEQNQTPPAEGNAPAASEPSFSAAEVERILAADREQRATSEPDDPVAKFRATTHGTKLYAAKQQAAKQPPANPQNDANDALGRIAKLMELNLMTQMGALTPPKPPKPMTAREKLTSADESIWLRRGNPNEWTRADREVLVQEYTAQLTREGFKGHIEIEAEQRAAREIAQAGSRALKNLRIVPDGTSFHIPMGPGVFRK